jgi:hypothetical protein
MTKSGVRILRSIGNASITAFIAHFSFGLKGSTSTGKWNIGDANQYAGHALAAPG